MYSLCGVKPDELWQMTPRDAEVMIRSCQEAENTKARFMDALTGRLCAAILEPHRDRDAHPDPFTAKDFMLLAEGAEEDQPMEITEETVESTIPTMRAWVLATGGQLNG